MSKKKETEVQEMSKSKQKREQIKKEAARVKRNALMGRTIAIVILLAIVGSLGGVIGVNVYYKVTATKSGNEFSKELDEYGQIQNIDVMKAVKAIDESSISVPLSEVEYTDESVDSDINRLLQNNKLLQDDKNLTVADGDEIGLDYVGSVDGVEFEGGNTNGAGTTLTIGSGSYIDDFETQLIGSHPGDSLTVNVTFPEPYEQNPDLSGKEASFAVTVNGIYTLREFDDDFVKEFVTDFTGTAADYRQHLKDTNYDTNLGSYLQTYLREHVAVTSYPKEYLKNMRSICLYKDEQNYMNYNQMYYSYLGTYPDDTFEDYIQNTLKLDERGYEKDIRSKAKTEVALAMTYQYFFEKAALSISDEEYDSKVAELGETSEETYGKGYIMQMIMKDKVIEYLKGVVTVA